LSKKNNEKKIERTTPEPIQFIKQLNSNITEEKLEKKKIKLQKRKEKKTSTLKKEKKQSILRRTY
jgi:hypothetical protein